MSNQKKKKLEAAIDHLFTAPRREVKNNKVNESGSDPNGTIDSSIPEERVGHPAPEPPPGELTVEPVTPILENQAEAVITANPEPTPPAIEPKPNYPTPSPKEPEKTLNVEPVAPEGSKEIPALQTIQGENMQVVVFTLDNQYYGIRIEAVESIIKMQAITELPHVASYIVGLTNLRGNVLPVISLRFRFGLPDQEATKNSRIIVIREDAVEAGLIVDGVTEVETIPKENIEPISVMTSLASARYVFGIAKLDDRLIILLDLTKVLAF